MLVSRGDPMIFIERPISAGLLIIAAIAIAAVTLPAIRKGREQAFKEE
jgi:putative tricarboxylic transport membrane protein